MLIIRKEQIGKFNEAALARFINETIVHIKEFTPAHCEDLGDDTVREVVKMGIDRARGYGLDKHGPCVLFVEMMFLFGSFFDTDPQYPWGGKILSLSETIDQMELADRLYLKTTEYLDNVACLEHQQRALERLNNTNLKEPLKSKEDGIGFALDEMVMCLHRIYPEKYEFSGEDAIRKLVRNAINLAEYHLPSVVWGPTLFSIMSFFLGHKCFSDPQFTWIHKAFNNDGSEEPQIADLVYSKMKEHFKLLIS